jgi:hypothetical protein
MDIYGRMTFKKQLMESRPGIQQLRTRYHNRDQNFLRNIEHATLIAVERGLWRLSNGRDFNLSHSARETLPFQRDTTIIARN